MNQWLSVCKLEDISQLGSRVIRRPDAEGGDIAVFRTSDDEVFALSDRCPHKGGPLSQGIVFGRKVACPLHGWVIGLDDGLATAPDEGCAAYYICKIEDGVVLVDLASRQIQVAVQKEAA
ncbi:MAG: nitrite reductase small subunit NirD [Burkholderiales bacterium]